MAKSRLLRSLLVVLILCGLLTRSVHAASFNGTVEAVAPEDMSITVKLNGKNEEPRTFTVAPTAIVLIDGKKSKLEDVSDGMTVAVVTNSTNAVTKLTLKTPKVPANTKKPAKRPGDSGAGSSSESGNWPQYRGPNRDNISLETGLLDRWPAGGPSKVWERKQLGEGYSSVAISEGKLFTMGNQGNREILVALDAAKGTPLWTATVSNQGFRNDQGNGPRGTPTVDADRVYALGGNGDLICAGVDNGDVIWQKNILREFGGNNIQWGISESVLIDGKNVICCPGGQRGTIVAIDKLTGQTVWRSTIDGAPQASYASPILVEYGKERLIVNFVHTGVVAVRAKNGDPVWGFPNSANSIANCSSPVYSNGMVFTASGYGTGCAMFKLSADGKAKVEYTNKEMKNHHGGMVVLDDHVYGFDEQILKCVNIKTGSTVWKDRSVGKGSITYADGHLGSDRLIW